MRKHLLTALLFCGSALLGLHALHAQDAYHSALQARLMNDFGLPAGTWPLGDSEARITARLGAYGSQVSYSTVANQDWTREARILVPRQGNNQWDAGYTMNNVEPIAQGDKVLWTFSIRSNGGAGRVSMLVERNSDFAKEVYITAPIDINWQTYFIAFEAEHGPYAPGELKFGFHLAHQQQDVRIGGFTALNYGDAVALDDLPSALNNENYDGSAADAPWRAAAANRIDQLRKAQLDIRTVDADGEPVAGVEVFVDQARHEFAFGTAIKACRIAQNNCRNGIFESKLTNLDGRGHGFNWAVFENDLKWNGWESEWYVTNERVAAAVQWLRERDIQVRGHALLWPGFDNMPDDVRQSAGDTAYVMRRIRNHIALLGDYPGIAGEIADWDVLNETVTNVTLADAFRGQGDYVTGREFYADVFRYADRAFPEAKLYLNDYVSLSLGNGPSSTAYQNLKRNVAELVDAGAPIDGIGFQSHIGGRPNGIPSVLDTYDEFYDAFGLEAKVTEFDLPTIVDDSLGAKYLADYLTATFSHESMTGFMFWNFWDVDTWQNPQANLFERDWTITPAGEAYVDLVFGEWWTNERLSTGAGGLAGTRAFKGTHEVSYTCGGEQVTERVTLGEDTTVTIACADFAVATGEAGAAMTYELFPNPTQGSITVRHGLTSAASLRLLDPLGREVFAAAEVRDGEVLWLDVPAGLYTALLRGDAATLSRKLTVR